MKLNSGQEKQTCASRFSALECCATAWLVSAVSSLQRPIGITIPRDPYPTLVTPATYYTFVYNFHPIRYLEMYIYFLKKKHPNQPHS